MLESLNKKSARFALLLSVFLLPWQTRLIFSWGMINGNPNEFLTASLYVFDLVLFIAAMLFVLKNYSKFKSFKFGLLGMVFSLFLFWNFLSIFWAQNFLLATQHFFWILGATLFAFLVSAYQNKKEILLAFLSGLLLSSWLGIFQFIFQKTFANKWLGLAHHDPAKGGSSVVEFLSPDGAVVRWLRAYGSFDHPNIFGGFLVIGVLLVIFFLIFHASSLSIRERFFLQFSLASFSIAVFMALSRAAWVSLIFGFLTLILVLLVQRKIFETKRILKIFAVVAVIFLLLGFEYPNQFLMRSSSQGRLENKSFQDRENYFNQGKIMIENNFFFGVGAGNFVSKMEGESNQKQSWEFQPVHNVAMLVWAETGLVGFALAMTSLALFAIILWKKNKPNLCFLMAMAPFLLVDHWPWSLHAGVFLVSFVLAMSFNFNQIEKRI